MDIFRNIISIFFPGSEKTLGGFGKILNLKRETDYKDKNINIPIKYFIFSFMIVIFVFSLRGNYGEDIWFHLAAGRYILENRYVPVVDTFSFSADGQEWINQSGLSSLVFYVIYAYFGEAGLSLFFALSVLLVFTFLYLVIRTITLDERVAIFITFLAAFFSIARFQSRPEAGSYVFIMILIYILIVANNSYPSRLMGHISSSQRRQRNPALKAKHSLSSMWRMCDFAKVYILRLVVYVALLFFIWSNWQAGFVPYGFMILFAYSLSYFVRLENFVPWIRGTFKNIRNRSLSCTQGMTSKQIISDSEVRAERDKNTILHLPSSYIWKVAILLVAFGASLFNPTGLRGIFYFIGVNPSVLSADFTEWGSIFRIMFSESASVRDLDYLFLITGYVVFLLIIPVLYLSGYLKKGFDKRYTFVLFLFPFVFIPLYAYRFIPLSIITIAMIAALLVDSEKLFRNRYTEIVIVSIMIILVPIRLYYYEPVIRPDDNKRPFQLEAIEFIRINNIEGNFINPLEDGGYLMFFMPERKVFIDQRLDIYTISDVYSDYLALYYDFEDDKWRQVVEKYDIELIILPGWQNQPLSTIISDDNFRLVYWSDYFIMLMKEDGKNIDFVNTNSFEHIVPFAEIKFEEFEQEKVLEECERLMRLSPISANPTAVCADLYYNAGIVDRSVELFERALEINKYENMVRLNLAGIYFEQGYCDAAIRHYKILEDSRSRQIRAIVQRNLGYVYMDCVGDLVKAHEYFSKFVRSGRGVIDNELINEAESINVMIRNTLY